MAQAQATLDPGHQLLTKGVMQFVVKEFREQVETTGEAGGGKKCRALQRVHHVIPAVRCRQNLPGFVGRNRDGWSYNQDSNAIREIGLHRDHTIDALAERKDQAPLICRRSVINMTLDLLRPKQQLGGLQVFTGNLRAQKQTGNYRGRAAAEPNSDRDFAFDHHMALGRGSVATLSRVTQGVKYQVGGIERKAFWSLTFVLKAEIGCVGRDEQRFQMKPESQPGTVEGAAQIRRRRRHNGSPAVTRSAVRIVLFLSLSHASPASLSLPNLP